MLSYPGPGPISWQTGGFYRWLAVIDDISLWLSIIMVHFLGNSWLPHKICACREQGYSPEEISGMILKHLINCAKQYLGKDIDGAVSLSELDSFEMLGLILIVLPFHQHGIHSH